MKQFAIFISLLALLSISLFSSCGGDKEIEKLRKDKEERRKDEEKRRKNEEERRVRLQALGGIYDGEVRGGSMKGYSSIAIGQDGERIFADVVVNVVYWNRSARAFLVSNSNESAVFSSENGEITATCKYSSRTLIVSSTTGWIFEGKKQ